MKRNIGCSIAAVFLMITLLMTGCGGKETNVQRDPAQTDMSGTEGGGLTALVSHLGDSQTGGTDTTGSTGVVGENYELVYMSMWGSKASEEDIEAMFPLGIWLKMTPDSANSGTALFNNGGGEGKWQYTTDGNRLQMNDGYSTIDAVIRDGFVLMEAPFDSSFNYCFADETADQALVSEISAGDTNPFDPAFDFTAGGAASGGGSAQGNSGNTTGGAEDFGYDFETAKQYIGDYQGMIIFENGVQFGGYDWSNDYWFAYSRIVIDEYGDPQVYLRSDLPVSMNFSNTGAMFTEEGELYIEGDYADFEWFDLVLPPDEGGIIEIWGRIGEASDGKKNFTVLLKPLGVTWDASEIPEGIVPADELTILNDEVTAFRGMTLEEILEITENFRVKQMEESGDAITDANRYVFLTEDLPAPYLLDLY